MVYFLPTGNLSLLSPSKKAQELDNATAWKRNMLSRNSKPSDLHIAGDTKGKMIEKRLQSQKRFICHLQKRKEQTEINTCVRRQEE